MSITQNAALKHVVYRYGTFVMVNISKCCNKAHNNKIINEMSRTREVGEVGFFAGNRLCLKCSTEKKVKSF